MFFCVSRTRNFEYINEYRSPSPTRLRTHVIIVYTLTNTNNTKQPQCIFKMFEKIQTAGYIGPSMYHIRWNDDFFLSKIKSNLQLFGRHWKMTYSDFLVIFKYLKNDLSTLLQLSRRFTTQRKVLFSHQSSRRKGNLS